VGPQLDASVFDRLYRCYLKSDPAALEEYNKQSQKVTSVLVFTTSTPPGADADIWNWTESGTSKLQKTESGMSKAEKTLTTAVGKRVSAESATRESRLAKLLKAIPESPGNDFLRTTQTQVVNALNKLRGELAEKTNQLKKDLELYKIRYLDSPTGEKTPKFIW